MSIYCLLNSIIYIAVLGILCFPLGRLLAKVQLNPDRFPFSQMEFEKKYNIYEKLKVKRWQNKVPDISKIFSVIVPKKQLDKSEISLQKIELMINETCVAELVHGILCIFGIAVLFIWPGIGGVLLFFVYILLGNLPFIIIQRYNRPRLLRLSASLRRKSGKVQAV